jgi:outer membrane protein
MTRRKTLNTALILAFVASSAQAADLMTAWQSAQSRDPEIAAARALFEQADFRKSQAQALWKPQVMAGGAVGLGGQDSQTKGASAFGNVGDFNTNTNMGVLARANLSAQKAWISPEREAQSKQLELSAQIAEVQWQQAQQGLIMRTAQKYFDVLGAELTLDIVLRQQKAVQAAAAEINKRQRVGDASVMDVQEANARVSDIRAQVLTLENNLAMKQVAYRQLVGQEPKQLASLTSSDLLTPTSLADANVWVQRAKEKSPALQMMGLQQNIQAQEAKRIQAGNATTLNWVAQAQMDRLTGRGMYGSSSNQMAQYMVGLQLNAPLSTGGMVESRELEALKQVEKLRFDQEAASLQVESQVRDAWQNIHSASARLQALEASNKTSHARLRATRDAHRTGARTTNEWLGAENDAAQAELAVVQLRIQTVMERLRLHAASGELGEAQLKDINALLR